MSRHHSGRKRQRNQTHKASQKLKICVVDDEISICELLKAGLSDFGYEVETFTSSLAALEHFKQSPKYFDAIISDYGMPDLTGLDLVIEMLAIRPKLPIFICTGYSEKLKNADDLPKGNTFLFKKPVTIDEITHALETFFNDTPSLG